MQQWGRGTASILRVLPLEWALLMSQTAFCPHTQPWKLQEHWESACWHWQTLKCVSVFMDLFLSANDNASVQAKMCPFPSWLAKMAWSFSLSLIWMLESDHAVSFFCSPALPMITSETLHLYLPVILFFPAASFILFSLNFCVSVLRCPRELHRRYLVYGHCFNHTNLSRSFWKIIVPRFKISHPSSILFSAWLLLHVSAWDT